MRERKRERERRERDRERGGRNGESKKERKKNGEKHSNETEEGVHVVLFQKCIHQTQVGNTVSTVDNQGPEVNSSNCISMVSAQEWSVFIQIQCRGRERK